MLAMQMINDLISRLVLGVADATAGFWENVQVLDVSFWQIAVDIFLMAALFYWLIRLLQGTRATNILLGLGVLGVLLLVSRMLDLLALNWVLDRLLTVFLVAIPILFQGVGKQRP